MIGRIIIILVAMLVLTVVATAALGGIWRFVIPAAGDPRDRRGAARQRSIRLGAPRRRDYAEAQRHIAQLDLPFALLFLAVSLYVLATPGIGGAWLLTFAFWLVAAVVRWLSESAYLMHVRCVTVLLLIVESLIVLAIRGGAALPQALVYLAAALVGALLLFRANELPFATGPTGSDSPYRRLTRTLDAPRPQYEAGMHMDTMPALAQRRPRAPVTPITQARRNPLRTREDAGAVLSPPYYASGR